MHSGGHQKSQNRTWPQHQRGLAATERRKIAPGPAPAHFSGHKGSQNRTSQRQRVWAVTEGHKIAPGPSASASLWSLRITRSHQAPAPAHSGGHKWSQNRTRPQHQRIFAVTKGHKIAPGPSASVSSWSQRVTKSHQAPTHQALARLQKPTTERCKRLMPALRNGQGACIIIQACELLHQRFPFRVHAHPHATQW